MPVVSFIVNLLIKTCLSGFLIQLAKRGQLRENCFTCLKDFAYSMRKSGWRLLYYISIINSAGHCTSRLSRLSLQFAFHDSITNRYSRIHLHFLYSRRHHFLFLVPSRLREKLATLRFIFIRSSYLSKYNYVSSARILAILWIVIQCCLFID